MRKLFLKYFFSILAITVLSLFIQNGLLVFKYSQSQNKWKDFVYFDFVDAVEENLNNSSFPNFNINSIELFSAALESDSRVSGFLVKDQEGRVSFTVGESSDGLVLSSVAPVNTRMNEKGNKVSTKGNSTYLNITYNGESFSVHRTVDMEKMNTYYIPQGVSANDVIGTVTILFESQPLSSIDILAYSPRTYAYSKDIINSCIRSVTIAVPICLIVALLASYFISSNNAKYIDSIRKALNELANGKSNVKLKSNKNSELNEITVAVSELDEKLQANKKSRQAWLTSISHDLNTPATSMKMIIEGLVDGIFKPTKTTIRQLQAENDTLCERINRVIEFSTLQADKKAMIETIQCNDFLSNLPAECNSVISTTEVEEMSCDKELMSKAVVELLKNALAATNGTEVKLNIKKTDSQYEINVTNNGHLPEDFSNEDLCEPWTKGDSSRSTSGNGLGLAIASSIAKLHNGEVFLSENEGVVTASIKWAL